MFENRQENDPQLIRRYEDTLAQGENVFFDSMEFEQIIEHYLESMLYPQAVRACQSALSMYPFSNELKLMHAEAELFAGDREGAKQTIEYLLGVTPEDPELMILMGIYCSMEENPKQAIELYLKAYQGCEDKLRVNTLLGSEYASILNYQLSIKYYSRAVLIDHTEPNCMRGLIEVLVESQSYTQGEEVFRKLVEKDPYNALAWHHLGIFLTYQEKWEEAIQSYNYAILIKPNYPPSYYDMSEVYMSQEKWTQAIDLLKSLIQITNTEDPYPYIKIGECYDCMDEFEQACEFYFKAANFDPGLSKAWYRLGSIHFNQEYKEQALQYTLQALEIDAEDIDYLRLVWEIYESLDNFEQARKYLRMAVEHPDATVEDYLDMAYFMYQRDELEDAMEMLKHTRILFPEEKETLYHFAAINILMDEVSKGLLLLTRAMEQAPELSVVISDNYPEVWARRDVLLILQGEAKPNNEKKLK